MCTYENTHIHVYIHTYISTYLITHIYINVYLSVVGVSNLQLSSVYSTHSQSNVLKNAKPITHGKKHKIKSLPLYVTYCGEDFPRYNTKSKIHERKNGNFTLTKSKT
jgi:hypothetical protein